MSGLNERNGDHDKSDKIKNHAGKQENGKEVVKKKAFELFKEDVRVAWDIYKQNWKTFVGFNIVIIISSFLILVTTITLVILWGMMISQFTQFLPPAEFFFILGLISTFPNIIVVMILSGCIYGLSYDLVSSGDEYTEIKNAWDYFKRYWWQYLILGTVQGIVSFVAMGISFYIEIINYEPSEMYEYTYSFPDGGIGAATLLFLSSYAVSYLFSYLMPSVTATGSFKGSFKENFLIMRKEWKRTLYLVVLLEMLLGIPNSLFSQIWFTDFPEIHILILIIIGVVAYYVVYMFIVKPIIIIALTKIYNSSDVGKKNKRDREIERNTVKLDNLW